ncbi:hybrid sensor histidine kinase/response regulator [Enterovibrio norvegicus]|uniref:histidine kinase n=2 Tax=Enterovibrio norvegicus TaxID=188144 RepID=A0A1I5VKK3_9GAMM|nr:hybrid sensor histidine kinase/response regulator [Enterovibrio norvegicus]SFQ07961.1 Signal transduction histidine kinase [Enterovibrio norvegicus DSM 15893]
MFKNDIPWYKTISIKALWILGLMLAVMVVSIVYVLETTGDSMVRDGANQRVEAQVETVAQSLGQLSNNIGTVALTIADILSVDDTEAQIEQKLATLLSNANIKNVVASGGFWPEPYLYNPSKAKASVFIAFNEDGSYRRVSDYNDASARPYQIEEWYAPARWSVPGSAYWSRAYIDPYTQEPMVTCSVPIYAEGVFFGVVTIDVRLAELQAFLTRSGQKLGGYLAMFDRSGRLMSDAESVTQGSPKFGPLPTAREIAASEPQFSELALVISVATQGDHLVRQSNHKLQTLAKSMVQASPDIDIGYALSIASEMVPDESLFQGSERLFTHRLQNDPMLQEPTLVFGRILPASNWMLVGALPERLLLVEATTLKNDLFFAMALVGILLVGVTYAAIHFYVVRPMAKVRLALIEQRGDGPFSPIDYTEQDELGMLVCEFNDISTDLVDAREKALDAARAKQLFLANISHEIRTPMNGILGATTLMQDEPMTGKQAEYLSVIAHSSRGLMSLINNILDFSKMESNHLKLEEAPFDLEQVGRYVHDLMLPTIKDKHQLCFEYEFDEHCPRRFMGDAHRIEQVILNLVSNALKFTENGLVKLKIGVSKQGGLYSGVVVRVTDTGVGIPSDKYKLIFDEFQQADASTTRRFGGSGLGLAITKQLVDLMGGDISIASKVGRGSQFDVSLPLQIEDDVSNETAQALISQHLDAFSGKQCLLVEDNAINCMIAEKMLSKLGFSIDIARDGVVALEKAALRSYDIIFMDIQMPRMDGLEATRQIRASQNINQSTPIVAMTANVLKDDIWRCISNGMQGHIGKPLRENDIYAACVKTMSHEFES